MDQKTSTPQPAKFEGLSVYRPPLCNELVGKTFELIMDNGYDYELRFIDENTLSYGLLGAEKRKYPYECLKPERTTYFINAQVPDAVNLSGIAFILDLEQSLVTAVTASLGSNPKLPRMPSVKIVFGAIRREDGTIPTIRHGFTNELSGKAIAWNYGTFQIVHVYSSERYYRVSFTPKTLQRMIAERPAATAPREDSGVRMVYEDTIDYIKIKDGIYVVNMVETILCRQNGHGNNLLFLMNLNHMHDVGRSFGTNGEGNDENYTFGAFGEYFDASDVLAKPSTYYIK